MKGPLACPHCSITFNVEPQKRFLGGDPDGGWTVYSRICPTCKRMVVHLENGTPRYNKPGGSVVVDIEEAKKQILVYPRVANRPTCPKAVPEHIKEDYNQACIVLSDSPKASAALSRRCLQAVLREEARVKPSNLAAEIQDVLDLKTLPSYLSDTIDMVRNIGNFAAHPIKSKNSGEIVDVEPGEAEWNLDVLESLFDFYYVQPKKIQERKDALNKKLEDAGKPTIE